MSSTLMLVGGMVLLLGVILSYLIGIRALQASRRSANYLVRHEFVARARWAFAFVGLFTLAGIALFTFVRVPGGLFPAWPSFSFLTPKPSLSATALATASPTLANTPSPAGVSPTVFVITSSPVGTPTITSTPAPSIPIAIEALFQGGVTPGPDVVIGNIRFSTEIQNSQPVGPANSFNNPVKHFYAIFGYERLEPGVQLTALWYHNGTLEHYQTQAWEGVNTGLAYTYWEQPSENWLPGTYEVQIFVGSAWKVSGAFTLQGDPPTITPTGTSTPTASLTSTNTPAKTATATPAPTSTKTPASTATSLSTRTPASTSTKTPTRTSSPSALQTTTTPPGTKAGTPSLTPTRTSSPNAAITPSPKSTLTPSRAPTRTATLTATFTPSRTPTWTLTPTRTHTPTATQPPTATETPLTVRVDVYFTDKSKLQSDTPPFERAVPRNVPSSANPVAAVVDEYFKGPNAAEQNEGLVASWNGFIGYRRIEFANGILHIYLKGKCQSGGTAYSIVQPLVKNVKQFTYVKYVKIYDEFDSTRDQVGLSDSGPICLDPSFTPSPTVTPTFTPSRTPTRTLSPTATRIPSRTPTQTSSATATFTPSRTPTQTSSATATFTPSRTPTQTPSATASLTPSRTPTQTSSATATFTPSRTPTRTPSATATRIPSRTPSQTPSATATRIPSRTPTQTPSATATFTPSLTPTQTPSATATFTPSRTPTQTPSATATFTPSRTPTQTPSATATFTPSRTPTQTPSATATFTPSHTPTFTPSRTPTQTPSATATFTPSRTPTQTPSATATFTPSRTPTRTPSPTATLTPSRTPTRTPSSTATRTPSRTPTRTPLPTATRIPSRTPTRTLSPTATRIPSRTPTHTPSATATLTPSHTPTRTPSQVFGPECNRASFEADITIPDNTVLFTSESFTKTWRLKNLGTCTWTPAYQIVFRDGEGYNGPASIPLGATVSPGATIEISINLTAPAAPGTYEGFWQLQDVTGKSFGVGPSAIDPLWVRINVIAQGPETSRPSPQPAESTTPTLIPSFEAPTSEVPTYDFVANQCSALWVNNLGSLPCPGTEDDSQGSITIVNRPGLEDGTIVPYPSLLAQPKAGEGGFIRGTYPEYLVQPGDSFRAIASCEADSPSCSAIFRLGYLDAAGAPHDLWAVGEFYDGKYTEVDIDLGNLAGVKVSFILEVQSLGAHPGNRALWVAPGIFRSPLPTPTASPTATPAWTSTPTPTLTPAATPTATPVPPAEEAPPSILELLQQFFENLLRSIFGG